MKIFVRKDSDTTIPRNQPIKVIKIIKKLKPYFVTVSFPENMPKSFNELIGMDSEKEILKDALRFLGNIDGFRSDSVIVPHTRYILGGPTGSGKSELISALAKTANVPCITFKLSAIAAFPQKIKYLLDKTFKLAEEMRSGCVMHFEEHSLIEDMTQNQLMFFFNYFIAKVTSNHNAIIILSTASGKLAVPPNYLGENAFNAKKQIPMLPPTLKTRQELVSYYLEKYQLPISDDVTALQLAKNMFGMYPKDIEYIVKETKLYIIRKEYSVASRKDFNEVMLSISVGGTHNRLTEKERLSTAYHEAGHVVAAYYTNPEYILGRVEITPRALSLGLTQEEVGEEKFGLFKHEFEYQIIYTLGGMAAEKIIYGETTSGVCQDLATANQLAKLMYNTLGMSDSIGPLIYDDVSDISSDKFKIQFEEAIQKALKDLYDITLSTISSHRVQLNALTNALLDHEVLIGKEIQDVLDSADSSIKPPQIK